MLTGVAATPSFAEENYKIQINGAEYEIGLDEPIRVLLPDGQELVISLSQDEFARYATDSFSFFHSNEYRPSRADLGAGIHQTALVTPFGTGVLIQEYSSINPTPLIDLMLTELTKEEVEYGYEYQDSVISRTVGGKKVEGKQAVTTYQDTVWTRSVYAYGKRDSGLVIMTFIQSDYAEQDQKLLDDFWRTLEIN